MWDHLHRVLLCAGWLGLAAAGSTQEPSDAGTDPHHFLTDPAFRVLAGQPGAGRRYALQAIPPESRQACYDWLRMNARPAPDQALECRVLAWLARDLNRPLEEIEKADDLVLQAAPDLPEGWLSRAAHYAAIAEKEPEKAGWALETFAQGLRRMDFAAFDWRASLAEVDVDAWFERAAQAGKLQMFGEALADAMHSARRGEAMMDAATFVRSLLQTRACRSNPSVMENLLDAMADAQPHLALGDALGFIELAREFDTSGQRSIASRLAKMLALAPVPQDVALSENISRSGFALQWSREHPAPVLPDNATVLQRASHEVELARCEARARQAAKLREGWLVMQIAWEDTMPRYLPMTQARELLKLAIGDDTAAFAADARAIAAEQPWNESLVSHALVSSAITDDLPEEALNLAAAFDVASRSRIALRLYAFAPHSHLPHPLLEPWLMDGAMRLLNALPEGGSLERGDGSIVLQTLDALEGASDRSRLLQLLAECTARPPRAEDADYWRRLSELVLRFGSADQIAAFAGIWAAALDGRAAESDHLSAIAAAAVRGGVAQGAGYTTLALRVWNRHFAARQEHPIEDAVAASRVAQALLACEDLPAFSDFVIGLQESPGSDAYSTFSRMTKELAALRDLLSGEGGQLPAVDAWVQAPSVEGGPARVQWRFVLPELDPLAPRAAPIRLQVVVGGRDAGANMSVEESTDARWWTAGSPHPLLRRLAGRYRLIISAGERPDRLKEVANVPGAADAGAAEVVGLPQSGCIRVVLREADGAGGGQADTRLYSLHSTLFATGREPDALGRTPSIGPAIADHPSPATWTANDDERWGRLLGPPVVIDDGTEYLLTQFAPPELTDENVLPAQLILLDERQRPLGPVPLVSVGIHSGSPLSAVYTRHLASTQRFRASDWGWAEDLVCLREKDLSKGEQTRAARYMAFVSRSSGEGVLPLLQLRRYREPVGGTGAEAARAPGGVEMPELNGEYITSVGFRVRSWHITMGPQRAIFAGEGRLAGFDVARVPWKPIMHVQSHLLLGNEWPLCFASERALVVEPSWSGDRKVGVRFVPFSKEAERYEACERRDLPIRNYTRGELSINHDGALLMLASENRDKPEPQAAWLFPDGSCSVCSLPRPPIKGNPGLEVAWWGPPANQFTLHEDGILFEMEVTDQLRLLSHRPGSPDDMPEGATPPKSKLKPQWRLERPDILTEHNTTTGAVVRRFHLPQPCEAKPMSFNATSPVFLYTTAHDIIRVNPPPRRRDSK